RGDQRREGRSRRKSHAPRVRQGRSRDSNRGVGRIGARSHDQTRTRAPRGRSPGLPPRTRGGEERRMSEILLGYAVGSGEPAGIPPLNLAVVGQTQQSGKTTTLEALVSRSRGTALAFVTKRGEQSFADGRRVQPYFRDRADWQFVTSIIDATLQEKNK